MEDELLNEIRQAKQHCTSDKFDYEDGYGEMCHLVWTALDIADELREGVLVARNHKRKIVLAKDIPYHYKVTITEQLDAIKQSLIEGAR